MGVVVLPLIWVWHFCLVSALLTIGAAQSPLEYDLQLVDGTTIAEGRIEILYEGKWGTICDLSFRIEEATVVCNQLGFQFAEGTKSFGPGSRKIVLDSVNCNGNEESIADCYFVFDSQRCDHSQDVGVVCSNLLTTKIQYGPYVGDLRLAGGPNPYEGRVEVYMSSVIGWATICSENWDFSKANLACRKLEYRPATSTGMIRYGAGTGPIANCPVSDNGLDTEDCRVIDVSDPKVTCHHNMDVDIVCSGTEPGIQGELRLLNGGERTEGRVEMFDKNQWKRLCSDDWGMAETQTACFQLGMPPPSRAVPGNTFGGNDSAYEFLEESINCIGQEASLDRCSWMPRPTLCNTGDAGIQCGVWKDAKEGDLRLSGDRKVTSGRLEVYHAGQWGTVCNREWVWESSTIGHVACRQLGYLTDINRIFVFLWGINVPPDPIWLRNLKCTGTENNLLECSGAVLADQSDFCRHTSDLELECDSRPRADTLEVRLVNGPYPNQGRLEVLYNAAWGTVCDRGWDINDAQVICRQLGFQWVVVALDGRETEKLYGSGDGEILFYDLDCEGSVAKLTQCFYHVPSYIYNPCIHSYDVGVVCYSDDYPSVDPRQTDDKDPDEEEGLPPSQLHYIFIVCVISMSVFLAICCGCIRRSMKAEATAVEVVTTETTGSRYRSVNQNEDAPPNYNDVMTEDRSKFPEVSAQSPPPQYNSQWTDDNIAVDQTML